MKVTIDANSGFCFGVVYAIQMAEDELEKDGKLYFLMNIFGASLACYASLLVNYKPFIILEGTWAIVSIFGFFRIKRLKD